MAMQYIKADKALRDEVVLYYALTGQRIEFQFPPKIIADSRKGTWKEDSVRGFEHLAVYENSGFREITLAFTYIVDGNKWTGRRIHEQVRLLRGYFGAIANVGDNKDNKLLDQNLVMNFKMYMLGGPNMMSCRFRGVDIKHGDSYVGICEDDVNGNIDSTTAFPLRTDVTIDLRIWPRVTPIDNGGGFGQVILDAADPAGAAGRADARIAAGLSEVQKLQQIQTPAWY